MRSRSHISKSRSLQQIDCLHHHFVYQTPPPSAIRGNLCYVYWYTPLPGQWRACNVLAYQSHLHTVACPVLVFTHGVQHQPTSPPPPVAQPTPPTPPAAQPTPPTPPAAQPTPPPLPVNGECVCCYVCCYCMTDVVVCSVSGQYWL